MEVPIGVYFVGGFGQVWKALIIIVSGAVCWLFILSLFIWEYNQQNSRVISSQHSLLTTRTAEQRFSPGKSVIFNEEVESNALDTYQGDSAEAGP